MNERTQKGKGRRNSNLSRRPRDSWLKENVAPIMNVMPDTHMLLEFWKGSIDANVAAFDDNGFPMSLQVP